MQITVLPVISCVTSGTFLKPSEFVSISTNGDEVQGPCDRYSPDVSIREISHPFSTSQDMLK